VTHYASGQIARNLAERRYDLKQSKAPSAEEPASFHQRGQTVIFNHLRTDTVRLDPAMTIADMVPDEEGTGSIITT
jgi:hypothetical protein